MNERSDDELTTERGEPVPLDYRREVRRRWWSWEGFAISITSLVLLLTALCVILLGLVLAMGGRPLLGWSTTIIASMVAAVSADGIVEPLKAKRRLLRWLRR